MSDQEEFERRLGTTLHGKWTLEKLLGFGGMAAVYVGVHKIGRRDAIKILHPEIARSKELRQRFEQEAHAVNRFTHPGAVEIRDIDISEDGAPFLVMELLEGQSLLDLAKQDGGVATGEILRLVDDLLDVLAAAHAQGIIHRDIKLDNLFVQADGRLKVLDFGIARMRHDARKSLRTHAGATLGTLPYMPPEQVKGVEIDGRADLFAVGATMFRLIAKRRIHEAANDSEMLVKMATQPAPPLESVAPSAPTGAALVVDRALAFERSRRYPDALTMQEDVRALRRGQPPPYASARRAAGDLPWTIDGPTPALAASQALRDAPTAAVGIAGPSDPTVVPRGAAAVVPRDAAAFALGPAPASESSTQVSFTAPVTPARSSYEEPAAISAPSSAVGSSPLRLASTSPTQWQLGSSPVSRVLGPNAPPRPKKRDPRILIAVAGLFFLIGIGIAITIGLRGRGDEATSAEGPSIPSGAPPDLPSAPLALTADPTVPATAAATGGGAAGAPRPSSGSPTPAAGGTSTAKTPTTPSGGAPTAPPPSTTSPPPPPAGPAPPPGRPPSDAEKKAEAERKAEAEKKAEKDRRREEREREKQEHRPNKQK